MSSPVDELKALGWTTEQIMAAVRQEISTEVTAHDPLVFAKAAQRVWERVREGKPTYTQLETEARRAKNDADRYEQALRELWEHPEFNRRLFRWVADTLGVEE